MTAALAAQMKVYDEFVVTGMMERIAQNLAVFNGASRNTIRLTSVSRRGNYAYQSFFKAIAGVVTRRDNTSLSAATDLAPTQDENISVKVSRKIGPVAFARDAFLKIGWQGTAEELSMTIGQYIADAVTQEKLNSALAAARAALVNQSAVLHTIPSSGTLTTNGLIDGLAKFGDAADKIILWVMHSKQFYDLVKQQVALNMVGVSGYNVASAMPVTLNRPVLVTDAAGLIANSPSDYHVLGLTANAIVIEDTEQQTVMTQPQLGLENIVIRLQGEYAYNAWVSGFKWDTQNGGVNPLAAALATGSNWDPNVTSYKDYAGVVIKSR